MILNSTTIEQTVDREERSRFLKDLVVVRAPSTDATEGAPLAMIRKRLAPPSGRDPATRAPVVLLHGYGQNRYAWHLPSRSLFNYLARAGFDVFNLELRGHGRSRHLGAHPPRHLSDFVEHDVPAAIAEVERLSGNRPVYLVGHSLGGLISYAAAAKLGDRIAGVVTLGSPYQFTRGSLTLSALSTVVSVVDRNVSPDHEIFGLGGVELRVLSEAMRLFRVFIESPIFPIPIRGFDPKSMEPKVLSEHMSLAMDTGSVAVFRAMCRAAADARKGGKSLGELTAYAEAFEALATPLLVISGTKDDLAPPASVEPAYLRSRAPDKTYRAFPRGHIDLIVGKDAPRTIWPLIRRWLETRAEAAGARRAA